MIMIITTIMIITMTVAVNASAPRLSTVKYQTDLLSCSCAGDVGCSDGERHC